MAPAVEALFERFEKLTGRSYHAFEYEGHPEADRVAIAMGSSSVTLAETAAWMNKNGNRTGVLKVRLFRPFEPAALATALPSTIRSLAVLDRAKDPGAVGDPLFCDVVTGLAEAKATSQPALKADPVWIGGRYGLSSKEFTPGMAKSVFDELAKENPKRRFTMGIHNDVTNLSLPWDDTLDIEPSGVSRAVFYGLGSDGTVGANKNSIKIIGGREGVFAQGYFVYDSKKSGAVTISHLRFDRKPIRAPYLVGHAEFVGVHQSQFIDHYDFMAHAKGGRSCHSTRRSLRSGSGPRFRAKFKRKSSRAK